MVGSAFFRTLENRGFQNVIGRTSDELDLRVRDEVFNFFEENRPRYVLLAAAKVGGILANDTFPTEFLSDNLLIQTNVMDAANKFGVEKLLFLGSACIYPKFAESPIAESALMTGHLEGTNDAYAMAKIAGKKSNNNNKARAMAIKNTIQGRFGVFSKKAGNHAGTPEGRPDGITFLERVGTASPAFLGGAAVMAPSFKAFNMPERGFSGVNASFLTSLPPGRMMRRIGAVTMAGGTAVFFIAYANVTLPRVSRLPLLPGGGGTVSPETMTRRCTGAVR